MKAQRKQFYFWLGVFVLPMFWSWFTLAKAFTRRERFIAFLWLTVFVAWLFRQKSAVAGELEMVLITYPAVLGWLTVALVVWLFFRIRAAPSLIEIIVLIDALAIMRPSMLFVDRIGQPFDWRWLLPPFMVAIAHLAVDPLDRWLIRRGRV